MKRTTTPRLAAGAFAVAALLSAPLPAASGQTVLSRSDPQANISLSRPRNAAPLDPKAALRAARTLFVDSPTDFLHADVIEQKLQKRKEFAKYGLSITRDRASADIVMEVSRTSFTTEFNYSVVDPSTRTVLVSGACNSLFGTASGKIANDFLKKIAAVR